MENQHFKSVSTFGEFMICPPVFLTRPELIEVAEQGIKDFSNYKFRHLSKDYNSTSKPDETILLEKIIGSLTSVLGSSNRQPLLLLSDGKDSMALALALSKMGIKCKTLSLLRKDDAELRNYISSVATNLGHTPYFVTVNDIQSKHDSKVFLDACLCMSTPVLDQGFFFFLFGCKFFFEHENLNPSDYTIIDGLGNDEHFGYLPSKKQFEAFQLSRLGIWKLLPRSLPFLRWYIRSPSEAQGDLSALAAFFPFGSSYKVNEYFKKVPKSKSELVFVDFRAFSRGSFHDHQCMMGKTIATANYLKSEVVFPWTEKLLAEYCFNLPLSSKFGFKGLKNKLLLRDLLNKRVGWNQTKRGVDLYFDLDISLFKKMLLEIAPEHIVNRISQSLFLSNSVKKRAYLELYNFYGYCSSRGISPNDIESILLGKQEE